MVDVECTFLSCDHPIIVEYAPEHPDLRRTTTTFQKLKKLHRDRKAFAEDSEIELIHHDAFADIVFVGR